MLGIEWLINFGCGSRISSAGSESTIFIVSTLPLRHAPAGSKDVAPGSRLLDAVFESFTISEALSSSPDTIDDPFHSRSRPDTYRYASFRNVGQHDPRVVGDRDLSGSASVYPMLTKAHLLNPVDSNDRHGPASSHLVGRARPARIPGAGSHSARPASRMAWISHQGDARTHLLACRAAYRRPPGNFGRVQQDPYT